ncbi:NAD(P)H-binding protein [Campylobacter sp. MIT 99-7217]|uniref:NAD(P)H-binding protein n=1 Tax=Campylobacter sp. MIT 99-7217 TaxID=535091 RepID=UPI0021AF05CB|nr:NAD(P)H-binding protein [Campylobacter sp. MIT 99-7217]
MKKLISLLGVFFGLNLLGASWSEADFKDILNKDKKMKILIIGANGSVAKEVTAGFLSGTSVNLRLFLRKASRLQGLKNANPSRVELVEGDATDKEALKRAMQGVDAVYANLAGDLETMAKTIIEAMSEVGLKRLVWISSFGVYEGEISQKEFNKIASYNPPHRAAVRLIEASDLDYTIIRAQWFSWANEIDYELTQKGEAFKNESAYISRKSIAHLVIKLCLEGSNLRQSLGINKP